MTPMRKHDRLEREAADWFARLNARTVTVADLEHFRVWKTDPDHRRAYEAVEGAWRRTGRLADDPDIVALTAAAAAPRRHATTRPRLSWGLAGVAGLAAMAVAAVAVAWLPSRPQVYETVPGERRSVRLEDGSRLELDTGSEVRVRLRDDRRELVLARGQALFEVAHDAGRPFRVTAGDTVVTATGTRFDVRREGDGARVTLLEGAVTVRRRGKAGETGAWSLRPGQQLTTAGSAAAASPRPVAVDVASVTSWTAGRLVFDAAPLADAVREINRYGDRPVVLAPGVDATLPISGAFDAGDAAAFAGAVGVLYGLRPHASDDAIVLRAPVPDNKS